jgi:hypothetical protein
MARSPRHRLRPPAPGTRLAPPHPFDCPRTPGVGPPSGTSRAARSASQRPSSCLRFHPSRSAESAPRRRRSRPARLLLTACSRREETGWQRTTPDDTGRHVAPASVPGRSNLRIRCPKGRGSSTLPSRTTSDLRILSLSLYRQSARETYLLGGVPAARLGSRRRRCRA